MLACAVVTSTHGVAGELKVRSFSGETGHIAALREALFRKGALEKRLRFESVRLPGGSSAAIVKIAGVETPEQAARLVGWEIWVARADAAPLGLGEFYAADLCGCGVWLADKRIGGVRSVWDGGPAQLLEVEGEDGRTVLVPFTEHFVGDVDVARGRIELRGDEVLW
jgi:16S rRNA processing protein RimM